MSTIDKFPFPTKCKILMLPEHNMTPSEKWARMANPQTIEDYGLGITADELMTFPEGVELMKQMQIQMDLRRIGREYASH